MKKLNLFIVIILLHIPFVSFCQNISLQPVTATGSVGILSGNGILASSNSFFTTNSDIQFKRFNFGFAGVGIESGVVLSTANLGNNPNALGQNQGLVGAGTPGTNLFSQAGITTANTFNAAILTLEIIPMMDTLYFEYVFASNEYNTYVNSSFNDVFGLFISGPNPEGGNYLNTNIAIVPNSNNVPVSINNVNNGPGCPSNGLSNSFPQFFVDNCNGNNIPLALRGRTVLLPAKAVVVPFQTYTIQIAVADVADGSFNSVIFLGANTLSSYGNPPISGQNNLQTIDIETCFSYDFMGTTYTESGIYSEVINYPDNTYDSLILNLTIIQGDTLFITDTICGQYEFGGVVYTESGTYYNDNVDANNCSSVAELNLVIFPNVEGSVLTVSECNSYTFNNTLLTQSGIYEFILENSNGCDSIVTLELTITQVPIDVFQGSTTLIAAYQNADFYQWVDCNTGLTVGSNSFEFIATYNGSFKLYLTKGDCTVETACYTISGLSIDHILKNPDVKIYPNPSNDVMYISGIQSFKSIEITDLTGRKVGMKIMQESEMIVIENNGIKGIFIIKITDDKDISYLKKVIFN